jgi:hypothetical protein
VKKTLLITFGCSWTLGVGVGYTDGMSKDQYEKIAWDNSINDKFSFRSILADRLDADNLNFSIGRSSNQRQFRLAKNFFISTQFKNLQKTYDNIVVLWGITSTARNELYSLESKNYRSFMYTDDDHWARFFVSNTYDHDVVVQELFVEMSFWNMFFSAENIKNYWFDTFNHHNYNYKTLLDETEYNKLKGDSWPLFEYYSQFGVDHIPPSVIDDMSNFGHMIGPIPSNIDLNNLIFADRNPRDLLSQLAVKYGLNKPDSNQHLSDWKDDTNRIQILVDQGILNPISYHPTRLGHEQIAVLLKEVDF